MLPVDQRFAIGDFAGGEEVGIAVVPHGRFEAHHRAQRQLAPLERLFQRRHGHRLDVELVVAARAALVGIDRPDETVEHQAGIAAEIDRRAVVHRLVRGKARGARPFAAVRGAVVHRPVVHRPMTHCPMIHCPMIHRRAIARMIDRFVIHAGGHVGAGLGQRGKGGEQGGRGSRREK